MLSQCIFGQKIPNSNIIKKVLKDAGVSNNEANKVFNKIVEDQNFVPQNDSQLPMQQQQNNKLQLQDIYRKEKSVNLINQNNNNSPILLDDKLILSGEKVTSNVENENQILTLESLQIEENSILNFGYNLFSDNPEIFQQSVNESVDPNYLVSPGDEIIVMLWGDTELNQEFSVSRDGYIFIPNLGQVFVNGLTVIKIEEKLRKLLKKAYSTLGSSTFFDISLGAQSLRPLRIIALGEVLQPGAYSVSHSATLFSSLFYFNGPSTSGSLRNIKLIRNGKKIQEIDYYNYLLKGIQKDDIQLQRDDVVFIPVKGKSITV